MFTADSDVLLVDKMMYMNLTGYQDVFPKGPDLAISIMAEQPLYHELLKLL